MEFAIKEYDSNMRNAFTQLFLRYVWDDLKDPIPEGILREKIITGVFMKGCETGVLQIALPFWNQHPIGFAVYQVDTVQSDWCKRPGWGLIREFSVAPEFRRQGCGKRLAAYAESRLRKKADKLYLTAHDADAVRFWTACGWQATGEQNENGTYTMIK